MLIIVVMRLIVLELMRYLINEERKWLNLLRLVCVLNYLPGGIYGKASSSSGFDYGRCQEKKKGGKKESKAYLYGRMLCQGHQLLKVPVNSQNP